MLSSLPIPKNGVIVSGSMHTPTTTIRARAGADRRASSMMPGTPMASNTTSGRPPTGPRPGRRRPARRAGRPTSWAPICRASARRAGEKSDGHDRLDAPQAAARRSRPGRPDRSRAPARRRPAAMPDRFTAWSPTAIGSVRAAWRGVEPVGHLDAASAPTAASARRSRRRPRCCRRSAARRSSSAGSGSTSRSCPAAGPTVSGPTSSTSAANSWPMKTSRSRSSARRCRGRACPPSPRSGRASSAPCLAKCRSEPQMPHALHLHEHLAEPGHGLGRRRRGRRSRRRAERRPRIRHSLSPLAPLLGAFSSTWVVMALRIAWPARPNSSPRLPTAHSCDARGRGQLAL